MCCMNSVNFAHNDYTAILDKRVYAIRNIQAPLIVRHYHTTIAARCNTYRVTKILFAPDDYNSLSSLTTWLNLTAWQPTARARGTLDSH
jgi:hypothetical protein